MNKKKYPSAKTIYHSCTDYFPKSIFIIMSIVVLSMFYDF